MTMGSSYRNNRTTTYGRRTNLYLSCKRRSCWDTKCLSARLVYAIRINSTCTNQVTIDITQLSESMRDLVKTWSLFLCNLEQIDSWGTLTHLNRASDIHKPCLPCLRKTVLSKDNFIRHDHNLHEVYKNFLQYIGLTLRQ